jgi:hypothetical protein
MDAIDRSLRERLQRAAEEMAARPMHSGGNVRDTAAAPRRTLRPLLAAVALAVAVGGVAGGLRLHSRLGSGQPAPAASPPAAPSPAVSTATPAPTPRWDPLAVDVRTAAWETTHHQLVAFAAGVAKGAGASGTLYTWDGTTWHEQHSTAETPTDGVLVDMPVLHGVALIGGTIGGSWLWDGAAWSRLPDAAFGDCLIPRSAAWDSAQRQAVVVVGNQCSGGISEPPAERWTFDGHTWRRRAVFPADVVEPAVAWDAAARTVVTLTNAPGRDGIIGAAWDASAAGVLAVTSDLATGVPRIYLVRGARWSPLPAGNYPERIATVIADPESGRALAIGQEPLPTSVTPNPIDASNGYYVLAWDGRGWTHLP